jgi:hypothetical protein
MASKKKQRRDRQRTQKPAVERDDVISQEASVQGRPPMAVMDRLLTLVGFGVLIILVILIAPYFAHKQDRDFEKSAQQVLDALSLSTSESRPTSETLLTPEVMKQLKDLDAYPADAIGTPFFQGGAKQASVRTEIKTTRGSGLLSVGFLLKQELSLDSRWHPVSFCRPDQQGAKVARDFLTALRNQNDAAAYALSAASVADLDKGVSLSDFAQGAKQWRQTHASALQALATPPQMPQVKASGAALTASWPDTDLSFLLLENPLQCAYVVQFTLQ